MKPAEIRNMSQEDIAEKIKELKQKLLNLRFQLATNNLENTNEIQSVKKDIARLYTIAKESAE